MAHIWKPNRQNITAINAVKDKKSNFADHMLQHNNIIKSFAMAEHGGIELLDLPVCEHCERLAANYDDPPGSAYCWVCGKVTKVPITLKEYLMQEIGIDAMEMKQIETEIAEQPKTLTLEVKR